MALIVLEKPNTPFLSVLSAQFQIFFTLPVFTSTEKKYSRLIVASVPQHTQNCTEVFDSTQQLLITIFVLETEEDQDMAGREGGQRDSSQESHFVISHPNKISSSSWPSKPTKPLSLLSGPSLRVLLQHIIFFCRLSNKISSRLNVRVSTAQRPLFMCR